jgi:hypothetical protein
MSSKTFSRKLGASNRSVLVPAHPGDHLQLSTSIYAFSPTLNHFEKFKPFQSNSNHFKAIQSKKLTPCAGTQRHSSALQMIAKCRNRSQKFWSIPYVWH